MGLANDITYSDLSSFNHNLYNHYNTTTYFKKIN